jgi:hypothetical protein
MSDLKLNINYVSCVKRIAPLSFLKEGLIALTPEIDCNKTTMGLPPVPSAVFLIAN